MANRLKTALIKAGLQKAFPWMLLMLLLSLLALAWSGHALYKANIYHQHLKHKTLQNDASPDAIFADAVYWTKRKNTEKATKLYAQAISSHDKNIRKLAHYNMANLYLHEAYLLLDASGLEAWDKVLPLLSIAKESYREALRLAPDWMDAKYNYELALRLVPTIESKSRSSKAEDEDLQDQSVPQDGWPAIPGFPRGMP